ncbi:MAG TPA: hypothetical protein P5186_26270 [Candidatus Paceibacterota bacterium]|nr:hypothetical protein [Verrucomicrobiota bacterium]HRY51559.1 hypothetical protein [Candidatus Paceibacterota bacterium]
MTSNPILEEVWRIQDELACEVNYDIHQLCENTRRWATEHPHSGPIIHNAEELKKIIAEKQRQQTKQTDLILQDKPMPPAATAS